jgi:hypothetical protein
MIHLTNISKQHGSRILFRDASMQILPATRTGLVGPNGAGKTTVFRLITGQEEPDKGEISCGKKTVIGYFSQDVGEMSGRSALAEVMAAAGAITALGEQIREMEAAMATPMEDDQLAALLERYVPPPRSLNTGAAMTWRTGPRPCSPGWASAATVTGFRLNPSAAAGKCGSPWPASSPSIPMCCSWTSRPTI